MNAVRQTIINIITTRPASTILAKASHDFMFSSFYILIIGLAVLGIVNLTMRINNRSRRYITVVNTMLFALLLLSIALANILFWLIRGY
ncbi:MAG: hypothetical protein ACQEP5_01995 [Actinomycetota bacterium]